MLQIIYFFVFLSWHPLFVFFLNEAAFSSAVVAIVAVFHNNCFTCFRASPFFSASSFSPSLSLSLRVPPFSAWLSLFCEENNFYEQIDNRSNIKYYSCFRKLLRSRVSSVFSSSSSSRFFREEAKHFFFFFSFLQ